MVRFRFLLCFWVIAGAFASGHGYAEGHGGYQITDVTFAIDGRTREWVLADILTIAPGDRFETLDELHEAVEQQRRFLLNERSLQDAEIRVSIADGQGDAGTSPTPVRVDVRVSDTWNIFVLPYFRYDSNEGLLLSLRGRDYNFFGTLSELEVNLDYERTEDEDNLVTISSGFDVPFLLFDRRWRVLFDQSFEVQGEKLDAETSLGLGYDFEWLGARMQAAYRQSYRYLTDDPEGDTSYLTSRVSLSSDFGIGAVLPGFGVISYRPQVFAEQNYSPAGISADRSGSVLGFDQGLRAGAFDWYGNYRSGQVARVAQDNSFNVYSTEADSEVTAEVAWYRAYLFTEGANPRPRAGLSAAAGAFYLIDGAEPDQDDAVSAARGILDDRMNGDVGVFANMDVTITVWTLRPLFEAQIAGFFDTAFVRDTRGRFYDSSRLDLERDLRFGSGIEVIGFPLFARSLFIRGSLGFDLREVWSGTDPLNNRAREIFIGLGHHY